MTAFFMALSRGGCAKGMAFATSDVMVPLRAPDGSDTTIGKRASLMVSEGTNHDPSLAI